MNWVLLKVISSPGELMLRASMIDNLKNCTLKLNSTPKSKSATTEVE